MRKVDPPKHKKDWFLKRLLLREGYPIGHCTPPDGVTVVIQRRMSAAETMNAALDLSRFGQERFLKVSWHCQHCAAIHNGFLPERWIAEEKAFFVEE